MNQVLGSIQPTPDTYGIIVEFQITWVLPHQPCKNTPLSCLNYHQNALCISNHRSVASQRENNLTTIVLIISLLQGKNVRNGVHNLHMVIAAHHQIIPIVVMSLINAGTLMVNQVLYATQPTP